MIAEGSASSEPRGSTEDSDSRGEHGPQLELKPRPSGSIVGRRRRELLLKLAVALHNAGTPSHQLEELLTRLAARLGIRATVFTMPTAIFAEFGAPQNVRLDHDSLAGREHGDVRLRRVEPGRIDLGRLTQANALYDAVYGGKVSLRKAIDELDATENSDSRSRSSIWLAYPAVAASAATLLGGTIADLLTSTVIGAAVGLLAEFGTRVHPIRRLVELLSAAFAALLPFLATALGWTVNAELVLVAGVTVLLPGMTLTQAVDELAHRHLASGSSRITGAALTFLNLGLGAAVGRAVGERLLSTSSTLESGALPVWAPYLALIVSALALAHLFSAPYGELPYIVLASGIAYFGSLLGSYTFSRELGVALAALALALFANGYARLTHKPAAIALVPGLIVLVPGSLGFHSLNLLIGHAAVDGIDAAVTTAVVATALVTGLLVANAILPERALLGREEPLRYTNSGYHPGFPINSSATSSFDKTTP